MSDTPNTPDDAMRLLDNGWGIVMFKNDLGSYTAVALGRTRKQDRYAAAAVQYAMKDIPENQLTDDFTPGQALTRLAVKVFGCELPS